MLLDVGLSHCCGAWLGSMQVESTSKCFVLLADLQPLGVLLLSTFKNLTAFVFWVNSISHEGTGQVSG